MASWFAPSLASIGSWLEQADRDVLHWINCRLDVGWGHDLLMRAQSKSVAVPVVIGVILASGFVRPRRALRALLTAAAAFGVCMGLASLMWAGIARPRPAQVHPTVLRAPAEIATCAAHPEAVVVRKHASTRPGFPSRHALTAGAFAVAVGGIAPWLGVGAMVFALLVAVGRVYAGVHWPSDVLVGLGLGALVAWGVWRILPAILGLRGHRHWIEAPPPSMSETRDEGEPGPAAPLG